MEANDTMTVSANEVHFTYGGGFTDWSFEIEETDKENGYCITKGQQWKGMTVNKAGNNTKVTIKADRRGSDDVAKWFKDLCLASYACDSYDTWPNKLNFAVKAILRIKVSGEEFDWDIVIAQGHNARSRNNWWFGLRKPEKLTIKTDNEKVRFELVIKPSGQNEFILSLKKQ